MTERKRSALSVYAVAFVVTALAVAIRWGLDPWLDDRLALVTIFGAVAGVAWYGGYVPAVMTAALGYIASDLLVIEPHGRFSVPDAIGLGAFAVSCGLLIAFGESMRRARLRVSQQRDMLRATLASVGDGVITTDANGMITSINPVAQGLTGWSQRDAVGQPLDTVFQIINEQTRQSVDNPAKRAIRDGVVVGLANHTILVAKDGTERSIDDSTAPIRDVLGDVAGCVLVFRDIAERREAERKLRRSERDLTDLFDNASIGVHWVGPDGRILRANQAELDLMGYDREEFVGRHIADFHVDQNVIQDILVRLQRGETLHKLPARLRRKDGSIIHALINSNAFFEDGEFVHSRCFTLDITDRKRAEEAQSFLAAIVSASDDAIVSKTLDGIILSWNDGAERLFGYPAAQAVGQHIDLIIPEELRGEERNILQQLRRGERIDHFETVRVANDGRRIDISLTISPIRDHEGQLVGASKVARDVTHRKQVEAALRASEHRFQAMANAAPVMIWIIGTDGLRTWCNKVWLDFVGRTLAEERGNGWAENVHPDDIDRCLETYRTAFEAGRPFTLEYRLRRRDGEHRWVLDHGVPQSSAGGAFSGYIGSCIDITDRRQMEEALRHSEERFRELANNIDQFAWTCDELGYATWYNQRWYDYTGTSFAEMQGAGWRKVHHPEHVDRVEAGLAAAVASGEPWEDTFPIRGKSGGYRWFLSRAVPIRDSAGLVVRWFGTNTDITEQVELERALKRSDRRKDEFLATLSHELRNPLGPISNALELLKQVDGSGALLEQSRDVIERQLVHLVRLVDDLLDVSRITRDRVELRRARVELASVVHQAVETAAPMAHDANQVIEVRLAEQPIYLDADPIRLAQVFSNLLNNACKYTAQSGRIRVAVKRDATRVEVSVTDEGTGIPPEELESIFEMFAQVDSTLERSWGGLGIGLTLARRLTEMHGGTVEAYSEGLGHGSTFVVTLPTLDALPSAKPKVAAMNRSDRAEPRRVLVVDDNRDSVDSLAMLLDVQGHETKVAYDGPEALELAEDFRPEMVLLDIGLPTLNGFEVCQQMRERPWGKDITIVALTGWGQDQYQQRSRDVGFDRHMVKPPNIAELTELLNSLPASSK